MNDASSGRLRELFDAVADMTPMQRAAYLSERKELDATTLRQLDELLRSDADFRDAATRRAIPADRPGPDPADWIGRRIGVYRIERVLGHGGMGSVFLAQRVEGDLEQRVAIKIVRPELLGEATRARFHLERQVLALLQHPNIAPMLDAGELSDGSPYAVIAYVEGVPIHRHVRGHGLDLAQCLRLFLQVCDAVAYAHRNLVVHRDLKPNNVLVDANNRPHLLDFGIAKPLRDQIGAIDIEETGAEQRFLSLSHAAPEQLSAGPVTTACDIYGLGALLYELLSGHPPLYRKDQTPPQLLQRILNEEPAAPGTIAASFRFRHDLDLIVLRCLRKRPGDRYASVEHLGDDIRRFLDGRPVQARRNTFVYRATRFVARHRMAVGLATLFVIAGASGALLYLRQHWALAQEQQRADEMTGLITDALRFVDPASGGGRDLSARDVFERIAAQAQASPKLSAASRAHILGSIAQIDLSLSLPGEAQEVLAKVQADSLAGAQRRELALLQSRVQIAMSRFDEARASIEQGLRQSAANTDEHRTWLLLDASLDFNEGDNVKALTKLDALAKDAWPAELAEERDGLRADALWQESRNEEALEEIRRVLAAQRDRLGESSPVVYDSLMRLARRETSAGNLERAEALRSELFSMADRFFSRHSLRYASALSLGRQIEAVRGRIVQAIDYETQSQRIVIDQLGENSPRIASSHLNLASLYEESGDKERAARHYLDAVAVGERALLPFDPNLLLFRTAAANFLAINDRCVDASPIARRALADIYENEVLREYDAILLTVAVADFCDYREVPDAGRSAVIARDLHALVTEAMSGDVKAAAAQLAAKAKTYGIEPAP